ncbi:S-adenosyl-L-methionine-dependent methyltransferase [Polyplosphaeria fusca]|uniref:S-adenosyl-L-methionine-dependent methyltransferase n=1 Tax=Polyplosphaeria fusca TaxID=682080 RepID=A0A9P4QY18_9PLEO|nr:S-adenosyl-L-methionine-dependent methyltransferase [Polyplosphaeria fusca]
MTKPTTVDMTFDTSLIDVSRPQNQSSDQQSILNTSFSTTESDPSMYDNILSADAQSTPTIPQTQPESQDTPKQSQASSLSPLPRQSTPVQYIQTQDAYNAWASVYDTDGNMLQSIDDVELTTLLPDFLSLVQPSVPSSTALTLIDLGCGTGRNTAKLLQYAWPQERKVQVTALDFSQGMLDVAASKLSTLAHGRRDLALRLEQCDCFPTDTDRATSPMPAVQGLKAADGIVSTLVLEHVSLPPYFATLSSLVKNGGYALVTNMHSEMGMMSQAGFVNQEGVKVRGKSYAHSPQETAEEAQRCGFEVLVCKERGMEKDDVDNGRVGSRGGKWVGVKVWYGLLMRKTG